jgi:hypothetical protein
MLWSPSSTIRQFPGFEEALFLRRLVKKADLLARRALKGLPGIWLRRRDFGILACFFPVDAIYCVPTMTHRALGVGTQYIASMALPTQNSDVKRLYRISLETLGHKISAQAHSDPSRGLTGFSLARCFSVRRASAVGAQPCAPTNKSSADSFYSIAKYPNRAQTSIVNIKGVIAPISEPQISALAGRKNILEKRLCEYYKRWAG